MKSINVADLSHEDVIKYHPELVANELDFEDEAASIAREALESAIQKRGLVESSPTAKSSLKGCIKGTAIAIDEWLELQAKTRRKSKVLKHIQALSSDQLAYLTSRELLNGAVTQASGFTNNCIKVGESVRRTLEYALFEEANPGLAHDLGEQLKRSTSTRHKQSVFRASMRSADFEGMVWDHEQKATVGFILVQAFIDATGLFEKQVTVSKSQSTARLSPTPTMALLLAEADIFDSLLMPYHYPMVIPPKPWSGLHDGGYLNAQQHPLVMVKTKQRSHERQLEAVDMDDVQDSINAIQATPWQINLDVLDVMHELHAQGEGGAKLASSQEPGLPEKPWGEMSKEDWAAWKEDEANAEVFKEWKAQARDAYAARAEWTSKRLVQTQQLKLADRFAQEPAIYFPHTVDFRGRIYPAAGCGAINPQGNDAGKALLQFSRGKALGPTGARWLAIHAANTFGADKISLDDRELWTLVRSEELCSYAEAPLENTGWMKADKPFGFLAVCFEWAGYMLEGDSFVSHIPVAMDGSCSGLQHFAALMKCKKTAESVNVIQTSDVPSDVYGVVLEATRNNVGSRGTATKLEDICMAGEWLERLERDTVKQPVMTTPYGVSARGIVSQIANNTKKAISNGKMEPFSEKPFAAAAWLAPYVSAAIGTETAAATIAMDWLKHVAKVTGKASCAVRWMTPIGFLAIQDYRKTNGRRVDIKWAGSFHKMTIQKTGTKLDAGRQSSGLAPNFIHSMDACHLMVTVNNCVEYGIKDFAMIHDSFGCHASDTELHNQIIRECFIAMYTGDALNDFYEGLREQVPEDVFNKIDPPPAQGDLDISAVRESEYFFA